MGFENLVVMTFMMTLFISEYGNCKHIVHPLNNSNINLVGQRRSGSGFIQRHGTHFLLNGRPHYFNGFNAYWLMAFASDLSLSYKVTKVFQEASKHGLNVARTWAFNDAGYMPLQISPGFYDENVFRGLDFVISEAGKYGIHLILSLVNNWKDNGGKNHYVEWARERGQRLSKDDDFFSNPITKRFYKNHVKAVLRRKNTITGVLYKNDPTIFAWELMNEPRSSDLSGQQIQEMAGYVKYIDNNHLLQIGLEGFYGESQAGRKQFNPGYEAGTDFIANNLVPEIDFATIHFYPRWMSKFNETVQDSFVDSWVHMHFADSYNILRKPILLTEFGMSSKVAGYTLAKRNHFYAKLYNWIYNSASNRGACAGGVFWQLLAQGMDNYADGYEVVLQETPTTSYIISQQSFKMSHIRC